MYDFALSPRHHQSQRRGGDVDAVPKVAPALNRLDHGFGEVFGGGGGPRVSFEPGGGGPKTLGSEERLTQSELGGAGGFEVVGEFVEEGIAQLGGGPGDAKGDPGPVRLVTPAVVLVPVGGQGDAANTAFLGRECGKEVGESGPGQFLDIDRGFGVEVDSRRRGGA